MQPTHRHFVFRCKPAAIAAMMLGGVAATVALAAMLILGGCGTTEPPTPPQARWPELPLATVPDFMHQTLFERVRFTNTQPMPIYGYSLVVNLHGTGDSTAPGFVRNFIYGQIQKSGFGSVQMAYSNLSPEQILSDKRVAIVTVEGELPVGARQDQRFDVIVQATTQSRTSSLAHGELYRADLSDHGLVDPSAGSARPFASALGGQVFVNPAYAINEGDAPTPGSRASLRAGTVLNSGVVLHDRPINLQLRQPQVSTARRIEQLIQRRWNDLSAERRSNGKWAGSGVASAKDEGLVEIYTPLEYKGDWKHFLGVVSHLYMNDSQAFIIPKARQLVVEAHKPNAPLADISLCWEAMGPDVLPIIAPVISDPNPAIAFAATRASAFLGDVPARQELLRVARDADSNYQIQAVQTLGALPNSPDTLHMLRTLLNGDKADVRITAYRILAENNDESIITQKIGDSFFLDVVPSSGPPLVFATNSGIPRLAVLGHEVALRTPLTFTAMETRFQLSSADGTSYLTLFYRDPQRTEPLNVLTNNDLAEIIARLGGAGPDDDHTFTFNFNDVVAIVQRLVDSHETFGQNPGGQPVAAVFQLEHPQLASDAWISVPQDTLAGRPQGGGGVVSPGGTGAENPKTAGVQPAPSGTGG